MSEKQEEPAVIAQKLKTSLEATSKGLSVFVESLEKSGFGNTLPAYRQMRQVLIQQRLWSDRMSREELQPVWKGIALSCENLHNLMKPFVDIMEELRFIDRVKYRPQEGEQKLSEVQESLLQHLKRPQFLSPFRLSRLVSKEREAIIPDLEALASKGVVEKKGWGNGASYRLR